MLVLSHDLLIIIHYFIITKAIRKTLRKHKFMNKVFDNNWKFSTLFSENLKSISRVSCTEISSYLIYFMWLHSGFQIRCEWERKGNRSNAEKLQQYCCCLQQKYQCNNGENINKIFIETIFEREAGNIFLFHRSWYIIVGKKASEWKNRMDFFHETLILRGNMISFSIFLRKQKARICDEWFSASRFSKKNL